jgi:Bacterial PH domain
MKVVGMAGDAGGRPAGQRRYRSPFAVVIWWLWALFALANLIDLAVQGRDHFSLETAVGLVLITGVVYAVALRPRITADDDGLTIVNPIREHRIGWPAVTAVDATELVRVRCSWPVAGEVTRERAFYAWAVHSSRRRQAATRMRAERRRSGGIFGSAGSGSGGSGSGDGLGGAGRWPAGSPGWRSGPSGAGQFPAGSPGWRSRDAAPAGDAPPGAPGGVPVMDAEQVATALAERAEQARSAAGSASPVPPVSRWHWPSIAAIVVPALAVILVIHF